MGNSFGSTYSCSPKARSARLNTPMSTLVPSYSRLQNDVLLGGSLPDTAATVNSAMVSSPTTFSVGTKFATPNLVPARELTEPDYNTGSIGLAIKLEPDVHDQLQSYSGRSGFMIKPTKSISSGEKETFLELNLNILAPSSELSYRATLIFSPNLLSQCGVDNLKALSPSNGVYDDSFERISFGSGSDQQFSFPRIWDLCRMAGLDIGQTRGPNSYSLDLSSGSADQAVSLKTERERQEIAQFVQLYEKHCVEVYAAIITPQLEKLRNIWQQFWRPVETANTQQDLFIELADRALYQTLLEIIVADSLKSMPPMLLHTVRLMVKRIQHFLRSALRQLSPTLINCKLTAISGFIKGLRRAIGLAHLSRAVVHVLETPERLEQMKMDVSKLDVDSIERIGASLTII
ncbi:unnamed protein product [Dibothriocephalus latus]|uniref:RFX1-4/6/8-like BCD domain-containing protein n=1 Tax=Dibothriocephalus latus TaxID=60516 RepID=A0A3P7LSZ8_DIBLA|nr:unnamed protein product [Dibothriocephalus latus]